MGGRGSAQLVMLLVGRGDASRVGGWIGGLPAASVPAVSRINSYSLPLSWKISSAAFACVVSSSLSHSRAPSRYLRGCYPVRRKWAVSLTEPICSGAIIFSMENGFF